MKRHDERWIKRVLLVLFFAHNWPRSQFLDEVRNGEIARFLATEEV